MDVILASGSPRRRELLAQLGLEFEVIPADIDESQQPGEPAVDYVRRLALEKAEAVASALEPAPRLVIAADTIVELHGELLGKPASRAEARAMLGRLSDATHSVHTAVGILVSEGSVRRSCEVSTTRVRFHEMSADEINWYVDTEEPMDKAGAYGIQAHGALFVAGLEGSYFNVVGLPIDQLYRQVEGLGVSWRSLSNGDAPSSRNSGN